MCGYGLPAIEVYHSDHSPDDEAFFWGLARRFGLAITGGTDFHGDTKPGIELGTGRGSLNLPLALLEELRGRSATCPTA